MRHVTRGERVNFEPERSEDNDRPDAWTGDGGPESLRSLMFQSNDDLRWPSHDLDASPDAAAQAGTPAGPDDPAADPSPPEPEAPAAEADVDRSPEDAMDLTTQRDETGATGSMADPGASTFPAAPSGWSDTITSTDGPHYWDRLMSSERDRVRRYHRPATIVFIQVAHLDRLGELWGEDVAAQSLVRVGRTVMRQIRSSDHAARIDVSRFAVFLPETDEIAAINFVERVRTAIEASLGNMAETVSVAIGWASPTDGNFDTALELAESRLAAELATEA
jgi:diguanylate cyclase (GGDEF)-like protein